MVPLVEMLLSKSIYRLDEISTNSSRSMLFPCDAKLFVDNFVEHENELSHFFILRDIGCLRIISHTLYNS